VTRHYWRAGRQTTARSQPLRSATARAAYEALSVQQPERRRHRLALGWAGLNVTPGPGRRHRQHLARATPIDPDGSWGWGCPAIPCTGPDIGGFAGAPGGDYSCGGSDDGVYAAVPQPLSDQHARREPWSFGEPSLRIVREFCALRERLFPVPVHSAGRQRAPERLLVRPLWCRMA